MMVLDMKPTCFMDFDGPINDNSRRLYQFLVNNASFDVKSVLSISEFWTMKRLGVSEVDWIGRVLGQYVDMDGWNKKKLEEIETESYLKLDSLHPKALGALRDLSNTYRVVIVTRRNNQAGVIDQIDQYGVDKYLDDVLVIPQGEEKKSEAIRYRFKIEKHDILVGDTEDDIIAGLELAIKTYFVLSGIRSKWIVSRLNAIDKVEIINDISEIPV